MWTDFIIIVIMQVKVITPHECYIKFIIMEHEGRRLEGEVIINLI